MNTPDFDGIALTEIRRLAAKVERFGGALARIRDGGAPKEFEYIARDAISGQDDPAQPAGYLHSLANMLEDHAGDWDSRLDEHIARALGWDQDAKGHWHAVGLFSPDRKWRRTAYAVELPAYTRSLDAAMSLLPPRGFADWTLRLDVHAHGIHGFTYQAEITVPSREALGRSTANPALALCAAALRARDF